MRSCCSNCNLPRTILRAQNHRGKIPGAGRRVQCGAQPAEASKTLTRRPATHHHAPDSRARPHATADWLRTFGRITPEISWRHTQRMTCDQTWQQSAQQGAQQSWHDAWHRTQRRTPHLGWRQRAHRTQQVTQLLRRTARCTESLI